MDWPNERYIRLYTRVDADEQFWPWQASAVFPQLLRRADRAGLVSLGRHDPFSVVAKLLGYPVDVVAVGLGDLLDRGVIEHWPDNRVLRVASGIWAAATVHERCPISNMRNAARRMRAAVLERFGHRCAYCSAPIAGRNAHVDHVIPLVRGGTNDDANLAAACRGCNLSKGARTPEEWLQ